MLRGCLVSVVLSWKASEHPICIVHFSWNPNLSWNEVKDIYPHICSKPHDSFPMTSHVPRRHPVAFGGRALGKSEIMYYNLQFWLFLGHLFTFSGLIIFSPETLLRVPKWLVMLCGYLATLVLPWKASKQPICSFLVKSKIVSKWA